MTSRDEIRQAIENAAETIMEYWGENTELHCKLFGRWILMDQTTKANERLRQKAVNHDWWIFATDELVVADRQGWLADYDLVREIERTSDGEGGDASFYFEKDAHGYMSVMGDDYDETVPFPDRIYRAMRGWYCDIREIEDDRGAAM